MNYGFLAILPPLVAVVLAVLFKNVLLSLFIGAYLGVVILKGGNPLSGLTSLIQDHVFVQAADSYNSSLAAPRSTSPSAPCCRAGSSETTVLPSRTPPSCLPWERPAITSTM